MKILHHANGETAITMFCGDESPLEIGRRCVPNGIPFLIVEDSALPEDWSTSAAWVVDYSNPSGIGLGPQRWHIEKAQARAAAAAALPEPDPIIAPPASAEEDPQAFARHVADGERFIRQADALADHRAKVLAESNALIAHMKAEVLQLEGVTL